VPRHRHRFGLRTGVGGVEIQAWYGQDPGDRHRGCPLRKQWPLAPHQQLSPRWREKLAFTVTATVSHEAAAGLLERARVGTVSSVEHNNDLLGMKDRRGRRTILTAANNLEFEKAALLRDQIRELKRAIDDSQPAKEVNVKAISYRLGKGPSSRRAKALF